MIGPEACHGNSLFLQPEDQLIVERLKAAQIENDPTPDPAERPDDERSETAERHDEQEDADRQGDETGWTYGIGAGTLKTLPEVIAAIEKSIKNLGGTIFLFFVLSQFVSYFTYTNMGTVMALSLSGALQAANIGALPLLLGFIVVVAIIDLLLTGAIAKWAIFAPVFVPLLMKLGVEPEAVLAAYRVGDSPMNAITPLNAYFALVVGFAQRYDRSAGVGTIVSLMLPYVIWMFILWTALFALWQMLGLPWGL
jgi:aminobenzoyl-glutamate transport protein